jgi:hypothetical protein
VFRGVVYMTEAGEASLYKHGVVPGLETFEHRVLSDDEFEALQEGIREGVLAPSPLSPQAGLLASLH